MNTFYFIIVLLALGAIIVMEIFAAKRRSNKKPIVKSNHSFLEKQNNSYEINSLQWDEYGNPYIYIGG
jgi:hypothetical protein